MQAAIDYLRKNTEVGASASSFLWDIVGGDHDKVVSEVKGGLQAFADVLDASKEELMKSAAYYRATDSETAANLDATYPRPKTREWDEASDGGILVEVDPTDFRDKTSPTDELKTGGDENYFQEWGGEFMLNPFTKAGGTVMDFGSPVGLVAEGLNFCGIADIFDKPVQWLGGDWEGYLKSAEAWGCLGEFCTAVAINIEWGNRALDETWHGNSADVAWDYFHELAQKFRKASEALKSLQEHYRLLAASVYNAAETVKGFIVGLCDLAVQVILFNIAAAAALASIAGAPEAAVLEALAMVRFMAALKRYGELLAMLDLTVTGVQTISLGLFMIATGVSDVKAFPKPGGGDYDNHAV